MRQRLKWRFDPAAAGWALGLFVLLVLLATVGAGLGWLRSFVGDVLAVVWVHCLLASVVWLRPPARPLIALSVGLAIEAAQYISQQTGWQVTSPVLRIVLGSTPDWLDVVAYLIGFGLACVMERRPMVNPRTEGRGCGGTAR
ncbi:ribosomal maturation YjgA family protein [Pseudoxanthomonas mexicana]